MFSRQKRDDAFVRDKTVDNEGGGLDAKALAALDAGFEKKKAALNDSDASAGASRSVGSADLEAEMAERDGKRNRERDGGTSDAGTVIEGLPEFDKYGRLFQDLTTRQHIDTNTLNSELPDREADVVAMAIAYDSSAALAIVTGGDEHFEL